MALVKAWEINFNAGSTEDKRALVDTFYNTPDAFPGGAANLRLAADGSGSFMTSTFGETEAGAVSYASDALMQAAAPANGTVAYCYDADPAKHGRFVRAGGAWGARTGDVRGRDWNDNNHIIRGHLSLWANTWSVDASGDVSPVERRGFPSTPDMRGGELRYTLRFRDFYKPEGSRLALLMQTRIPSMEAGWPDNDAQQAWCNMIQIADPLDQPAFGGGGFFDRSPVVAAKNTGWRERRVRLSPDDRYWMQMGGKPGRQGMDGEEVDILNYVCAPADAVLGNWTGNIMIVGFYPSVDPANREAAPAARMHGHIDIQKIEMWLPE